MGRSSSSSVGGKCWKSGQGKSQPSCCTDDALAMGALPPPLPVLQCACLEFAMLTEAWAGVGHGRRQYTMPKNRPGLVEDKQHKRNTVAGEGGKERLRVRGQEIIRKQCCPLYGMLTTGLNSVPQELCMNMGVPLLHA